MFSAPGLQMFLPQLLISIFQFLYFNDKLKTPALSLQSGLPHFLSAKESAEGHG
jgi:hypothetical protein